MKPLPFACTVIAALALTPVLVGTGRPAAAEGPRLRYVSSLYIDEKGGGLSAPEGVACGPTGRLVVADTGNGRLVRFSVGEKGITGGTEMRIPQLPLPSRVHMNSRGEIYALDISRRRVVHLGQDGAFKAALGLDDAPSSSAVIVKTFTIDAADRLYVLDVAVGRVLVLDAQGRFQRAVPVPVEAAFAADLAVDSSGTVYLLDSIKRRLFAAGKDAKTFTPIGGDLSESLLTLPSSMAAGGGMLLVLEGSGSSIVTLALDGSFLSRQLTQGWEEGALNHPGQACVGERDEIFVADRDNSRVQVFRLAR